MGILNIDVKYKLLVFITSCKCQMFDMTIQLVPSTFKTSFALLYIAMVFMPPPYSNTPFRHSVLPSFRIQFPLINSVRHGYIQMKFGRFYIGCHENTQVEFEFGSGRIIFGRVMSLGLRKIPLIFSFHSLFPLQIDILN